MEIKNLCIKEENKEIEEWLKKEEQELEDYFQFVEGLVDRKDIKDRMKQMKDELIVYVVDSNEMKIPRVLEGKNRSFVLPDRADAFVREQSKTKKDGKDCYIIKCGFAYRKKDYNGAVKFQAFSRGVDARFIFHAEVIKI